MKYYLRPGFALLMFALLNATTVLAETEKKMVIAFKADGFELTETDINSLAVGEAKTIETDSGKVIDILRTSDGAEIYVDGELLEMDFNHDGLHADHAVETHVEIICDSDAEESDCADKMILVSDAEDINFEELHEMHKDGEDHKVIIIKKKIVSKD
jgi:hypothetical protein